LFCSFLSTLSTPQQAQLSDAFVGSIGVNVHMSFGDCFYTANYASFKSYLVDSGIRRFRDGMIYGDNAYYTTFMDLASAGLTGQYIVAPTVPLDIVRTYPQLVGDAFERYEGPNEYDAAYSHGSDPNWVGTLQNWTKILWENHNTSFKVVAPSLTQESSYFSVGDLSKYVDYGNMHNYHGTFEPETPGWGATDAYGTYGATTWNMNLCHNVSGSKPIMTTESGYLDMGTNINGPIGTGSSAHLYVPSDIQANYLVRLLFHQFGVLKVPFTYIYEFVDCGSGDDLLWGLMGLTNTSDPTKVFPRPSYLLIQGLTRLFADPIAFSPGILDWSMNGTTSNIFSSLFQRSNGTFYLTLWIAQQPWDPNASGVNVNNRGNYSYVAPQQITLVINSSVAAMSQYVLCATSGGMTQSDLAMTVAKNVTTIQLAITETPTVFSIDLTSLPAHVTSGSVSTSISDISADSRLLFSIELVMALIMVSIFI